MFFEVLVSLLGKHGVAIHDVNVIETGEVKIDIDFSEHDKVFEDKIAELQIKNDHLVDEKNKLREIINKKLGGWDDYGVSFEEIFSMRDENKELKQRIAELESKLEMYESECDPRNHSKEIHYFAIAQNQFFRKENERLKNKNKILYDYIHGITGNAEDEIDKNIKSLESNENHVDIKDAATPIDISTHLINNTCTINELEQIAEHLLVYCKHNKTSE